MKGSRSPARASLPKLRLSGNAMLTMGGASTYTAVVGRTPPLLPDMQGPPYETGTVARDSHRMRAISLQKITEATSRDRVNRAIRRITTLAGEDFHTSPETRSNTGRSHHRRRLLGGQARAWFAT